MRTFIRHPSDIPIEVRSESLMVDKSESLKDVSFGGISFRSERIFVPGAVILVRISFVKPVFEARGKVVWCRQAGAFFDVGLEFLETNDVFRARMVEQICRIERYKKEMNEKEGRHLSGQEAALEWINKFAGEFQNDSTED